jgi:hypothetical protein
MTETGPFLRSKLLGLLADAVDDLESMRKSNENRLRTLTDTSEYGFGFSIDHPDVLKMANLVAALNTKSEVLKATGFDTSGMRRGLEQQAILDLQSVMRAHPLWQWAKPLTGVGEKQFARLFARLGDPYWAEPDGASDAPRTFGQLKSYCGLAPIDGMLPVPRRRKPGEEETGPRWNRKAKSCLFNIASKTIMFDGVADKNGRQRSRSPYRDVYDEAKRKYADATHAKPCVGCGTKGKPAQPGSPLSMLHKHRRAITLVMVAILRDLYNEAARLHGVVVDQTSTTPIPDAKSKRPTGVVDQTSRSSSTTTKSKALLDDRGQTSSAPMDTASPKASSARKTKPSTRKSVRKIPRAAG